MTGPVTTEALVDGSAEPMTETEIAAIMAEDPNYPPCPAPPPIPVRERYYLTECEHCGWVGSSEQCGGDAYPGDDDIVCPVCCSSIRGDSPNEADTAKHGEAVYQRIVQAEAALQQVTAERDEARNPFGNLTPTVERVALLMGQVWLEAKGGTGDTITSAEEFALFSPEDYADCCTVAKAVLGAVDPAKANERADAAEASLATATSELARLRAEGEAKDRALKPFADFAGDFDWANATQYGGFPDDKVLARTTFRTLTLGDLRAARTALARAATAREGQADE